MENLKSVGNILCHTNQRMKISHILYCFALLEHSIVIALSLLIIFLAGDGAENIIELE